MDKQTLIIVLGAVFASPLLVAVVNKFFDRFKAKAETHNINITGELGVAEFGMKAAKQIAEEREALRVELLEKIAEERKEHQDEIISLKNRLTIMEESLKDREKALIEKNNLITELRADKAAQNKEIAKLRKEVKELKDIIEEFHKSDIKLAADLAEKAAITTHKVEEANTELKEKVDETMNKLKP